MRARLRFWWGERSEREQRLLLVMAALFAVVLAWLLVIRPLGDALADARARHDRAVIALAEARGAAGTIGSLEKSVPVALPTPINIFVGQRAAEAGFTVERIEPQGSNAVTLSIAAARPQAFFAWASDMERSHGLIVDRLTARPNPDKTLAVQATFRARAG